MSANYIVRIQGSDEIYAAPSLQVANAMKAVHDKWVTDWLSDQHSNGGFLYLSIDDMLAVVEECDDLEGHAEMLQDFSYSNWGINEADLIESEMSQSQLFQEGGTA